MTISRQNLIAFIEDACISEGDQCQMEDMLERLKVGEELEGDVQRQWLRDNFKKPGGCECPTCKQNVELKARKIYPALAKFLIALSKFHEAKDIKDFDVRGGDYAKLRLWELIEQDESGLWSITLKGRKFVADKIRVEKYLYVFRERVRQRSDDTINIREALGNAALYDELMAA